MDQVSYAVGEGVGFAGAGAGDDQEGRFERGRGGGALLGVEGIEEGRVHAFNIRSVSVGCCNARGKKCKRRTNRAGRYIEGHYQRRISMVRVGLIALMTLGWMVTFARAAEAKLEDKGWINLWEG